MEEKELIEYLQENKIAIGASIEAAAYEGPFTLDLDGKHVQISYKAACQIYIDMTQGL